MFLLPEDAVCMRTIAVKLNIAGPNRPFADLFFLVKKDTRETPRPVAEKPFFQYDCSQFYVFAHYVPAWIYSCADVDQLQNLECGPMGVIEKVARLLIIVTVLGAATMTVIQ